MMTNDQWEHSLMRAIWNFDSKQAEKLIRSRKGPVDFRYGPAQTTPFLEAVANGLSETAELLVRLGADIHAVDGHGRNAVLVAVWRYSATLCRESGGMAKVQLLKALVRNGIDCFRRCDSGATALDLARRLTTHGGAGLESEYVLENQAVVSFLEGVFSPKGRNKVVQLQRAIKPPTVKTDSCDLLYELERHMAVAV